MAGDKHLFAPVPLRAMAQELSGLQLRVLICVAAHDRMSLVTGKGQGCRASNERMKAMVGCNFSRLCSTLTQLVELGLLEKEKLGRHTVYRVIYADDDRLLFGNVSRRSIGCQAANRDAPIGCRGFSENGEFRPENHSQYIPLNGGRDSVETGEENSSEDARFAARRSRRSPNHKTSGINPRPKAGLSRAELADNPGGQMARLERALSIGAVVDRLAWYSYLEGVMDDDNPSNSGRATRLADRLVEGMDDADHGLVDEGGKPSAPHSREAAA